MVVSLGGFWVFSISRQGAWFGGVFCDTRFLLLGTVEVPFGIPVCIVRSRDLSKYLCLVGFQDTSAEDGS
jgi:hypothetical protein